MYLEVSRTIQAPIESVWAVLADFANGAKVYSLIESGSGEGVGVGAVLNTVMARNNAREVCVHFDPAHFVLAYTAEASAPSPIRDYISTVRLTYVTHNSCIIHWSCHYKWVQKNDADTALAEFDAYVKHVYSVSIDDLERHAAAQRVA
jgi:hypothetical protein